MAYTTIPASSSGGGSGTVTSVASADASVTITNATTTPDLAFAASTAALAKLATAGIETSWASLRHPAILALAPTLTRVRVLNTTNVSTDWETATATTTGLFVALTTENGGVIQSKSGTTGTGLQIGRTKDAVATSPASWIANTKTSPWAIAMRVKVTTTQDANGTNVIMSMNNSGAEHALVFRGPVSTTNFTLWVNGGGSTTVDTGQAVDVGTYHNLALVFDLTTLWLVYDDVKVSTGLTDLTNFGTTPAYIRSYAVNGGTAANREHHICEAAVYTPAPV